MSDKLVTERQMDGVLNKYGFSCVSFSGDHSMYIYCNLELGIYVKVYTETNEFEIEYVIDNSIMSLKSPVCSPFYEEAPKYGQFNKIFTQFMKSYNKLI